MPDAFSPTDRIPVEPERGVSDAANIGETRKLTKLTKLVNYSFHAPFQVSGLLRPSDFATRQKMNVHPSFTDHPAGPDR